MSNACDTIRVPGFSSAFSFGISRSFSDGEQVERHHRGVPEVARRTGPRLRNLTLSVTPAALAFSVASVIRRGSMSMPTPRAP